MSADSGFAPQGLPPMDPSCQKYDKYNTRIMATINLPPVCETVSPDLFGLRSGLADAGWGIQGMISPTVDLDLKNRDSVGPQRYAGQKGSGYLITNLYATYDLTKIGFPAGGQFTASLSNINSHDRIGEAPKMGPAVTTLGIIQPLLDGKLEVKAGNLLTIQDFVGMNLTGNAGSTAQGLSSVIPAFVGLSVYTPTPTLEVTVNDIGAKNFYNRFAVQRSVSPLGALDELRKNPHGLRWKSPGTSALYINEFGYKTGPEQGGLPVWARVGVIYNTTNYPKYDGQTAGNNYGVYAGITKQITRHRHGPGGLNVDFKVNYAPSDRNIFTKDYAINLFYIGPFASRPFDMVAAGFSQTFQSRDLQAMVTRLGVRNSSDVSSQLAFSYSYRVTRGVFFVQSLSAVTNPGTVFGDKLPTALILNTKLMMSF